MTTLASPHRPCACLDLVKYSPANLISPCDCHVISSFCKILHLSCFPPVFSFSWEKVGGDGVEEGFQPWSYLMGQLWPHPLHTGPPPLHRHMHIPDPGSPEQMGGSGQGPRGSGGRDGAC